MTVAQYKILSEAARLREVDKDYRDHLQAFLNFRVQSRKRAGKNKERPVYSTFKKFYDYEKEVAHIRAKQIPDRFAKVKKIIEEEDG